MISTFPYLSFQLISENSGTLGSAIMIMLHIGWAYECLWLLVSLFIDVYIYILCSDVYFVAIVVTSICCPNLRREGITEMSNGLPLPTTCTSPNPFFLAGWISYWTTCLSSFKFTPLIGWMPDPNCRPLLWECLVPFVNMKCEFS